MTAFTILLGGTVVPTIRLKSQIANTIVIAADSGIRHAKLLELEPILWVGDFDSTSKNMKRNHRLIPKNLFPREKNMTDGEIAVHTAMKKGATRLVLCGAFGGEKTDHVFFHMTIAIALAERHIPVMLTSGSEEGWPLVAGHYTFDFPNKTAFSIVAFSSLESLSIHGAKWPLHSRSLDFGSSRTLSNTVSGKLSISLQSGKGLLLSRPR
ncbi:MAG: thiamine pyrophosphokinase [Candidatus Tokpelaia sp. JSC085]|nr:MAG: thiamine pyrophosphokinase [Candidatus Tokpelaia sp. JSC085]